MDDRRAAMLALLQQTPGFVTVGELAERLNVSRRTIYYDLEKVNVWLKENGLEPAESYRLAGIRLPESSRARLPELVKRMRPYDYVLSPKERKAWMAVLLFTRTDPVHANDLAEFLLVSRVTVLYEMKQLKTELAAYGLRVAADRKSGYLVEGDEGSKRKALARYLSHALSPADWKPFACHLRGAIRSTLVNRCFPHWNEERLNALCRLVADCERSLGVEFTDEMVFTLASRLFCFANRIKQGETVKLDEDEKTVLRRMTEYRGARQMAGEMERMFHVDIPEDEICYLTVHLLGAKLNRLDEPDGSEDAADLRRLTQRIVDRFEQLACVFFERRDELEEQLFLHLKPAYYRLKYGLECEHPLLETMRSKYAEVFELTGRALQPLEERLGKRMKDDEVAFVAMHFGGWLRRQNTEPIRRRTAAIVCAGGVSTSRMLKLQLEALFPYLDIVAVLSLREYERFRRPVDVWFSTVRLEGAKSPVFVLNPVMTDREKAVLLNEVNRRLEWKAVWKSHPVAELIGLIKRYADVIDEAGLADALAGFLNAIHRPEYTGPGKPGLADLLPPARIRLVRRVPGWKEAIAEAARPLVDDGLIEPRYIRAMVEKIERFGLYIVIAPGVAIAHAKPDEGALGTGMSLLIVREGVRFSVEPKHRARALFVLASADGESHLRALAQLTALLKDEQYRIRLTEADSIGPIRSLIGGCSALPADRGGEPEK